MFFASEEVNRRVQFRDPKKPKASTEFLDGICKDDVQVGDKLIYISGLSSFVIVRADDGWSVRLISPAVMWLKTRPGSEELYSANRGVNLRPNVRERDLEEFALAWRFDWPALWAYTRLKLCGDLGNKANELYRLKAWHSSRKRNPGQIYALVGASPFLWFSDQRVRQSGYFTRSYHTDWQGPGKFLKILSSSSRSGSKLEKS
jgi:hypothetical protein